MIAFPLTSILMDLQSLYVPPYVFDHIGSNYTYFFESSSELLKLDEPIEHFIKFRQLLWESASVRFCRVLQLAINIEASPAVVGF